MLKEESVEHAIVWTDAEVKKMQELSRVLDLVMYKSTIISQLMSVGRQGRKCLQVLTICSHIHSSIDAERCNWSIVSGHRHEQGTEILFGTAHAVAGLYTNSFMHDCPVSNKLFPHVSCFDLSVLIPSGTVCRDVRITHVQVLFIPFSHHQLSCT